MVQKKRGFRCNKIILRSIWFIWFSKSRDDENDDDDHRGLLLHCTYYSTLLYSSAVEEKIRLEDEAATWGASALLLRRSSSKISYSCRSSFLKESPGRHKKTMFIKLLHALLALWWFLPYSINEMTLGLKTMVVPVVVGSTRPWSCCCFSSCSAAAADCS